MTLFNNFYVIKRKSIPILTAFLERKTCHFVYWKLLYAILRYVLILLKDSCGAGLETNYECMLSQIISTEYINK